MSIHCKLGDTQSVVYYKIGNNDTNKSVVIKNAPIEVTVKRVPNRETENFDPGGFGIRFYSPNNRNWPELPIHDFQIFPSIDYDYGPNYEGISLWVCGATDFWRNPDGSLNGPGVDITTISFIPNLKCPKIIDYDPDNVCSIDVKYNNSIVFSDRGECPINYQVVCGEECPPGTAKCYSDSFPGYCCLPCNSTRQQINGIKNAVKRVNKKPVSYG